MASPSWQKLDLQPSSLWPIEFADKNSEEDPMELRIFDSLLEPTFVINEQLEIVYCNEPAALLAGLSTRKIIRSKMGLTHLFQFQNPVEALSAIESCLDATPYQEVHFSTESGRSGRVQVTVQPFATEAQQNWLIYFRDVTLEEHLQKKYRKEFEQKEVYIRELEAAREKLEDYSKNLEAMVTQRTAELSRLNQMMRALLDSLGQGFFIFDEAGEVLEITSKACKQTVEKNPRGQKIWEALGLKEKQIQGLKNWIQLLFNETLPFEDLAPLGPARYPHSQEKEIELQYYPLRGETGAVQGTVVVATDITQLVQARREAEVERAHAQMILHLIRNKRHVGIFIRETKLMLSELKNELAKEVIDCDLVFRILHTLKGGSASLSLKDMAEKCHLSENALSEFRSFKDQPTRTDLKNHCQEVDQSFWAFIEQKENLLGSSLDSAERTIERPLSSFLHFVEKNSSASFPARLKDEFYQEFLLEPAGPQFSHYPEVIESVAEQLGKVLKPFSIKNPDFRFFPEPYQKLFGTLIHAVRNAVDHGIEPAPSREAEGKDPAGEIELSFRKWGSFLLIKIRDDGAGISADKIRSKLMVKGIDVTHENNHQVIQHIFDSQFSTKDHVTELSGRGVGMDAIAGASLEMGGRAWVRSKEKKGTSLLICVPWITWNKSDKNKKPTAKAA